VLLTFSRGRGVIGAYSALTDKPTITDYKAIGEDLIKAFAIPRRPLLDILEHGFPEVRNNMIGFATKQQGLLRKLVQNTRKTTLSFFGPQVRRSSMLIDTAMRKQPRR
jgi:hypothetical protein